MKPKVNSARVRAANNAMWAAILAADVSGMVDAIETGANPDIRRRGWFPMHHVANTQNHVFICSAYQVLAGAGADMVKQHRLLPISGLAASLIGRRDGALERVWEACPAMRPGLMRACLSFSCHKDAGLEPEQWPGSLDRLFALPGCHEAAGRTLASFGSDWHHGGFDRDVVERLVAFDLDPRREVAWDGVVEAFCQAVALYDHHGLVVDEIVLRHADWLGRDGGGNGHALAGQLLTYGEGQQYRRLHKLAPFLVGGDRPTATMAMTRACFQCSSTSLMPGVGKDPAIALARQGFSLRDAFTVIEPGVMHKMIKHWQCNHWVARYGSLVQAVIGALDRVAAFGLDVRGVLPGTDQQEETGRAGRPVAIAGAGLMHIWCEGNDIHHDTGGAAIDGLHGFEHADGPSLLEVATRPIEHDQAHGARYVPIIGTLNWALSCGADLSHPGAAVAAERIVFALCGNTQTVDYQSARNWCDAVRWLISHRVQLPPAGALDALDSIVFDRPFLVRDDVNQIKMEIAGAHRAQMHRLTAGVGAPVRSMPRF